MSDKSHEKWKTIETKLVSNILIKVIQLPTGKRVDYVTVNYPEAVGVVAMTNGNKIVMVGQYRYAVDEYSWEIPMGSLEEGESIEECARRELREEAGYIANNIENICSFYPSNAASNQVIHLYLATELRTTNIHRSEPIEELIKVKLFNFDEVLKKVLNNEIKDAATIISILLVQNRMRRKR